MYFAPYYFFENCLNCLELSFKDVKGEVYFQIQLGLLASPDTLNACRLAQLSKGGLIQVVLNI